jgi:hypothetical protein
MNALSKFDSAKLATMCQKLKESVSKLEEEKEAQETDLEEAIQTKVELMQQLVDTEQRLEDAQRHQTELEDQLHASHQANEQLQEKLAEFATSDNTDNRLTMQIRFLRQDCDALKRKLSEVMHENSELERKLNDREAKLQVAIKEVDELQTAVTTFKVDVAFEQERNESLVGVLSLSLSLFISLFLAIKLSVSVSASDLFFSFPFLQFFFSSINTLLNSSQIKQVASLRSAQSHLEQELQFSWLRAREAMAGETREMQVSTIFSRVCCFGCKLSRFWQSVSDWLVCFLWKRGMLVVGPITQIAVHNMEATLVEMKKEHERAEVAKNAQIQNLHSQLAAQTLLLEDAEASKSRMEQKMRQMTEVSILVFVSLRLLRMAIACLCLCSANATGSSGSKRDPRCNN